MTTSLYLLAEQALADDRRRTEELATRLVASGPKAAHVSASETHEIADAVHEMNTREPQLAAAVLELLKENDEAKAALAAARLDHMTAEGQLVEQLAARTAECDEIYAVASKVVSERHAALMHARESGAMVHLSKLVAARAVECDALRAELKKRDA